MTPKIMLATIAALCCTGGAIGCVNSGADVNEERHKHLLMATKEAQEAWVTRREEAGRQAEAQAKVISLARQRLLGRPIKMQRQAAICLEARRMMDDNLREVMESSHDCSTALDEWHGQEHGVRTFCAYALEVEMP